MDKNYYYLVIPVALVSVAAALGLSVFKSGDATEDRSFIDDIWDDVSESRVGKDNSYTTIGGKKKTKRHRKHK